MKLKHLLCGVWFIIVSIPVPYAQGETRINQDAPKVLTADLVRRQHVESSELDVSFVIYDDDNIVKVQINGETQNFEPANTITIDKLLTFKKGKNLITVVATDEQGNQNIINYLVEFGRKKETAETGSGSEFELAGKKVKWKILGDIQYNSDSNPNNDLGLPIDTGDTVIEGQIPDSKQSDTQLALNLLAVFTLDKWKAFGGYSQSTYSKSIYESLNSRVIVTGASYGPKPDQDGLDARYAFLNVNMGGESYAQFHMFDLGYQFGREDKEDGTTRHLWGFLYNHKVFSSSSLDTGNSMILKWEYTNLDIEKQDFFRSLMTYGTGSDGSEASKYSVMTMDYDWSNKWNSGFLQGIGLGMHYKEFPNQKAILTDFGDTRIDVPFRFSLDLGWEFNSDWSVKYKYEYRINISTKSPSYKTVNGLQLNGGF